VPNAPEAYVHRIGRTGRAGREGVAITLVEPREHRLLRNIERVTGQRIEVSTVPTVADLREKRKEMLRSSLRETLVAGELDPLRSVVEDLASEFDAMDIAAAALKLLQDSQDEGREGKEEEIPTVAPQKDRPERGKFGPPGAPGARPGPGGRPDRGAKARGGPPSWDITRLWIGAGRRAGMRPADLVGAIAGEAGLDSSRIGAIQIGDSFSLVEVPEPDANRIIAALKETTLRGKKVIVRKDKG
jgi:ATP-dependent RNA helicase DeaD